MEKGKISIPEKRTSRSEVMVDKDDILILEILINKKGYENISGLMEELNISYNGLKTHLNRLENFNFITMLSGKNEDYRKTLIFPTEKAFKLISLFSHAINYDNSCVAIKTNTGKMLNLPFEEVDFSNLEHLRRTYFKGKNDDTN